MRLYLSNLLYEVNESDIARLFEPYGAREIYMPVDEKGRSRGIAFVVTADTRAGEQALLDLDGLQFMGRRLHVVKARSRREAREEREGTIK